MIQGVSFALMSKHTWYDLAKLRIADLGMTQDDLKKTLQVKTRGAVGHYLSGRRQLSPDQLVALAKKLKITLDELLTGKKPNAADEDLLALSAHKINLLIDELDFSANHPIRQPYSHGHLVAHAYVRLMENEGVFDETLTGELREKIRIIGKITGAQTQT